MVRAHHQGDEDERYCCADIGSDPAGGLEDLVVNAQARACRTDREADGLSDRRLLWHRMDGARTTVRRGVGLSARVAEGCW